MDKPDLFYGLARVPDIWLGFPMLKFATNLCIRISSPRQLGIRSLVDGMDARHPPSIRLRCARASSTGMPVARTDPQGSGRRLEIPTQPRILGNRRTSREHGLSSMSKFARRRLGVARLRLSIPALPSARSAAAWTEAVAARHPKHSRRRVRHRGITVAGPVVRERHFSGWSVRGKRAASDRSGCAGDRPRDAWRPPCAIGHVSLDGCSDLDSWRRSPILAQRKLEGLLIYRAAEADFCPSVAPGRVADGVRECPANGLRPRRSFRSVCVAQHAGPRRARRRNLRNALR